MNFGADRVENVVVQDLRASVEPLVVTGYAGLDTFVDFASDWQPDGRRLRVLFGQEPFPSRREEYSLRGHSFPEEVQQYWLSRGISLLLSAKIVRAVECIRGGRIEARYVSGSGQRLHAKIYCGDEGVTLGSSNFTAPGMRFQLEANARFTPRDGRRFEEARDIAENYWSLGSEYSEDLAALLESLLRVVSWQEALARACAELLEGEWAERYLRDQYLLDDTLLWPSQRQGIAQALYILSRQGSVLVADATGSGKTRMGVHLIDAVVDYTLRSGRLRQGKALMVCPPTVAQTWEMEAHLGATQLDVYSHGALSHERSQKHELTVTALRRAQVLCVDEGHNFLNVKSNRTRRLLRNMADYILLFTATPLNKSVVDLLRIADMLGADNLEPSTLKAFKTMLGVRNPNRSLTLEQIDLLRAEIQKFTVRRTKKGLNALIDRAPDEYRDKHGRACRFPAHEPKRYPTGENARDREIAREIRGLADGLYAVSHFVRPVELPAALRKQGWTEERYLRSRLNAAKKIARYMVMASLRSSRAALTEHLVGTRRAIEDFALETFRKQTPSGDVVGTLKNIRGKLPRNKLSVPLPDWLGDSDAHAVACDHDREIYLRILDLVRESSDAREESKAELLAKLLARHSLLLAFDSRPITLALLRQSLGGRKDAPRVLLATGDPGSQREELMKAFAPGSKESGIIGLCSDSLSEGVNLQQASAMVHLDMPSVVRVAEQRAGRVDRMDSPHPKIQAWWPDDSEEFALSSDERFLERYETVENLLGANMPLPEAMQVSEPRALRAQELIQTFEQEAQRAHWDGIQDAFAPVRKLVEGEDALVPEATYAHYRGSGLRVLSRVSLVEAESSWAFFCLAAGAFGAPRWVLFPSRAGKPLMELGAVASELRARLGPDTCSRELDEAAALLLDRFVERLGIAEQSLLSRRKQRALEEMEVVVERFQATASEAKNQEVVDRYAEILQMLRAPGAAHQPDWEAVATRWLDLIRPIWYEKLAEPRKKPLLLRDIRNDLLAREAELGPLILEHFRSFPVLAPPDERIIACIIGVA